VAALCLGEALVDFVCERRVAALAQADAFVPHLGGAAANVALTAARHGASVALAGGAGEDAWGHWVRDRLSAGGVETRWFELAAGAQTPVAVVHAGEGGEPTFQIYSESIERAMEAVAPRLEEALDASDGLVLGSNTLVGREERRITMSARERALGAEKPVLFDANLRLRRWRSIADAAASANACVPGALLVRVNRNEAEVMTGEPEPERAALALLKAGARMVVLSLGTEGAILRGRHRADAESVPARVLCTLGAGDVLTGVLLAHLQRTGYYPAAAAAGLREAVAEAGRATERWGALA